MRFEFSFANRAITWHGMAWHGMIPRFGCKIVSIIVTQLETKDHCFNFGLTCLCDIMSQCCTYGYKHHWVLLGTSKQDDGS